MFISNILQDFRGKSMGKDGLRPVSKVTELYPVASGRSAEDTTKNRRLGDFENPYLVGVVRIERTTLCLKGRCSTTELHTHKYLDIIQIFGESSRFRAFDFILDFSDEAFHGVVNDREFQVVYQDGYPGEPVGPVE